VRPGAKEFDGDDDDEYCGLLLKYIWYEILQMQSGYTSGRGMHGLSANSQRVFGRRRRRECKDGQDEESGRWSARKRVSTKKIENEAKKKVK